MTKSWITACLLLTGCSAPPVPDAEYQAVLDCEMRVLVVANFVPSLSDAERASMRGKLAGLSREMLARAATLGKSTAEIAADQQQRLQELQRRMQGPAADAEANRLIVEARRCVR